MSDSQASALKKCPTGITGFDELSEGGLPRGRATLLAGQAGAGKTLFAMGFVLNGITQYQEPGVFVSFEESPGDLAVNIASLGFDLPRLQQKNRLRILHLHLDPNELIESGEFDLEGIFLRLGTAIDAIGARRIALDAVENLFSAFVDLRILRGEFRRLLNWLKDKGITAVVTTERGQNSITRHGLEEYIADCVVTLDNRVDDQIATRRLRIVKYRGSAHDSDECPFILDRNGFSVMPITSAGLAYTVSSERVSTGIPSLDAMLDGGVFRGSSILVTGTAGTGKSSIAAHLVDAACRRGERCLYVALEESRDQIERNMTSIGFDLAQWHRADLLRFHASRPTSSGLETHLATVLALVDEFQPNVVVVDPISAFSTTTNDEAVKLMLIRLVDLLKSRRITSLFNALTAGNTMAESTAIGISSLMDVWFLLRNLELAGERTRGLYVCKARGMAHSNQIREFLLTDNGVRLVDVLLDDDGALLTGSARQMHLSLKENQAETRKAETARRREALENRRHVVEAKIAALRAEFDEELRVLEAALSQEETDRRSGERNAAEMASQRSGANRRDQEQ